MDAKIAQPIPIGKIKLQFDGTPISLFKMVNLRYTPSLVLLLVLILNGCQEAKKEESGSTAPALKQTIQPISLEQFTIGKGQLGPLRLGHQKNEMTEQLQGYQLLPTEVYDWGYDGSGDALLVRQANEDLFALIPTTYSQEVIAFTVASKRFKTPNGVHVGMTVKDLLKVYPRMEFGYDPMNDYEISVDSLNHWVFVFMTDSTTQIGSAPDEDAWYKPKNVKARIDRIIVQ